MVGLFILYVLKVSFFYLLIIIKARQSRNTGPALPNTTSWQPKVTAAETLKSAFLKRCIGIEEYIRVRAQVEKSMNIQHFDSGLGIEDIIRDEFQQLLPNRYTVKAGVVSDSLGKTAGDSDVIIFNDLWFPMIKSGATAQSRRIHVPINGTYAVGEIKQTLDFSSFDSAMEKLVVCHRLHRPKTNAHRVVENRELNSCVHGMANPLYSFIIATDLKDGLNLDQIANRFYNINKTLKRTEVVRALCVLGHGTLFWGFKDHLGESRAALFMMEDLYCPIYPVYAKVPEVESALYALTMNLLLHLYHSVLAPEDVAVSYGPLEQVFKRPQSSEIVLKPDREWLDLLKVQCNDEHDF